MRPRLHLTPARWVLLSLAGFVVVAASLSLTRFVHATDTSDCIRWIAVLPVFGLFLFGGFVTLYASKSLKNGIRNHQWPEDQIEPLRSRMESPFLNVLSMTLLATYGILWLMFPKYRVIGFDCFLLTQVLAQLRTAVRRPPAKPSNLIAGWRDLSPIHSDQWGRR